MLVAMAGITGAAPPPLPSSFHGTAQISGADVPAGTPVSALIAGVVYAETSTFLAEGASVFIIDVPGDDPDTPGIEGGSAGDTIVFQLDGFDADQTGTWSPGSYVRLDLTATPPPTPPEADDQAVVTDENTPVDIILTASDINGDPLTFSIVDPPSDGTLTGPPPDVTYTPDPFFNGSDGFTFIANDGGFDSNIATVSITVASVDQAPTADAGGPYIADEGQTFSLDGSGSSDPDDDIVLYEWDLDEDGVFGDAVGVAPNHVVNDNGSFTVGLRVTDSTGASDTDTADVTIRNVAPTVHAGGDRAVAEGAPLDLLTSFSDPSTADTHTATIDWGDGLLEAGVVNQSDDTVSGSHVYVDNGSYTVELCVRDDDGDVGCDSFVAGVANVAPSVEAGPDQSADELDEVLLLGASFTDPGVLDTHTATIDWGDVIVEPAVVDESGGSGLLSGSHTYAGNGTFPIVVCVVDDDGDGGCDSKELVIRPGVPDLVVEVVDRSGVTGDWQTLEVSGTVSAEVANRGNADAVGTYGVVFFEDADGDGVYDPGIDLQFGVTTSADLAPGASTIVTDTISGTVSFRDNLIYAYVDSEDAILESDETNNVSHSGLGCEFPPVWDLSTDWSDSANPNGVWTYREGSNPLPFIADWTPLGSDSVQPAWSPGAVPGNHLPAWFKSTDIVPGYDFLPGDVVVHSTDFYNGPGRGVANVIWTSPVNATVNISGEVWPVRDIGRENTWRLSLQRESAPIWPLTDGHVADGDPFDRANPFDFATGSGGPSVLNSIAVSAGDEIQLDMIADPEVSGGDFVGVNLTITETECVAPPSGLVGWWPGNGNTDDIVGGNHGALAGDATFGPGMVGQAFSLDGDGDYVDLGTAVGDFGTGDFTVQARLLRSHRAE
jgi:hypothetical protein